MSQASENAFNATLYKRHNSRRQEHLASLGLDLTKKKVLEVGAGTGDHSSFFIDRSCDITITEARAPNLAVIKKNLPTFERIAYSVGLSYGHPQQPVKIKQLDMDNPPANFEKGFDVGYCYGLLYHLAKPAQAIKFLADRCDLLLMETCVSFGTEAAINPKQEPKQNVTQSFTGGGCRPTRQWVWNELKKNYKFVYIPKTQPYHAAFPTDWENPKKHKVAFVRAIFIASNTEIKNDNLLDYIPMQQIKL